LNNIYLVMLGKFQELYIILENVCKVQGVRDRERN
jgi:hypothetical protein